MGMHGRDRSFIVMPHGFPSFHLPSDLLGFTTANYDHVRVKTSPNAAVGAASTLISQAICANSWSQQNIAIKATTTVHTGATYPLKLYLNFTNNSKVGLCLVGKTFSFAPGVPIAPNAPTLAGGSFQVQFLIGKNTAGVDLYPTKCVLEPGASIDAWIPIDQVFTQPALEAVLQSQATGTLRYRAVWLSNPPSSQDLEKQF